MIPVDHDNFEPDAELHGWKLHLYNGQSFLTGRIFADKSQRWPDDTPVRTSFVQFIHDGKATTRNTRYLLKEPA